MANVKITCEKDPLIEKHCRDAFEDRFQRKVDRNSPLSGPGTIHLLMTFRTALKEEAERQEWYNFEIIGACRKVLRDAEGNPQLLVPQIEIVP